MFKIWYHGYVVYKSTEISQTEDFISSRIKVGYNAEDFTVEAPDDNLLSIIFNCDWIALAYRGSKELLLAW